MEVEGIVDFIVPLEVHQEVLATPYFSVAVGRCAGRLIPPRIKEERDGPLTPPRLRYAQASGHLGTSEDWGTYFADHGGAQLQKVLLRFPVKNNSREAVRKLGDAIRESVDEWFRRLVDWIQRLTGQSLEVVRHITDHSLGNRLFLFSADDEGRFGAQSRGGSIGTTFSLNRMTRASLRLALDMASKERDLPLEHQLAATSYILLGRAYRTALITACTAVEVAIRDFVRANGITVNERLFGTFLARLVRHEAMTNSLRVKLQSQLLEPRNRCVHEGYAPTFSEAHTAVMIAGRVTAAIRPLRFESIPPVGALLDIELE